VNKELYDIIKYLESAESPETVLATVVDVKGSSYRLPGARMLITERGGQTFGMVSGGCLERDVIERARRVLETGAAQVFTYDTTRDENSVFSLNMGCRGVIRILLETASGESLWLKTLRGAAENRKRQAVATLVAAYSAGDVKIGGKILYSSCGQFRFENLPRLPEKFSKIKNDCIRLLSENGNAGLRVYEIENEKFEFFLEIIEPPVALLIFGAGADAVPLAEIGAGLGWQIIIADHRPAFLNKERFPRAAKLVLYNSENLPWKITVDDRTAGVVMTHNYEHDREILPCLLNSDAFYVGALGPKRRTDNLLRELKDRGDRFGDRQLRKLFAPVGLNIGADTPEAIALSIAAEIQAVHKARPAGFLRDKKGSINDHKALNAVATHCIAS
jgi:xanthine/CO dehydrogenase XdhC/CoxF family maturation factor